MCDCSSRFEDTLHYSSPAHGGWGVEASFRGGVRLDARLPGTPAEGCRLRVVFRAWRGSELMEERVLESAV